jgi:hypothetical protein
MCQPWCDFVESRHVRVGIPDGSPMFQPRTGAPGAPAVGALGWGGAGGRRRKPGRSVPGKGKQRKLSGVPQGRHHGCCGCPWTSPASVLLSSLLSPASCLLHPAPCLLPPAPSSNHPTLTSKSTTLGWGLRDSCWNQGLCSLDAFAWVTRHPLPRIDSCSTIGRMGHRHGH